MGRRHSGGVVEESPDIVEGEGLKVSGGPYYGIIKIDGGRILSPSDIVDFLSGNYFRY